MDGDGDKDNDRDLELLAPTITLPLTFVDGLFCGLDGRNKLFGILAPLAGFASGSNDV